MELAFSILKANALPALPRSRRSLPRCLSERLQSASGDELSTLFFAARILMPSIFDKAFKGEL